jgi:hypothetical protein
MRIALSKSRAARLAVVVWLVLFAGLAAQASADVGTKIIERCTHGQSISGFSQQAYRRALQELPTEVEEYSDCANLIRRAQLAATTPGSGGPGIVQAIPPSQKEQKALNRARKAGAGPLRLSGQTIQPGVVHANVASAFSSLPDPLLAVLAFLLACALALSGREIARRVRAHRAD